MTHRPQGKITGPEKNSQLQAFTVAFFEFFQADVRPVGPKQNGALHVELTPELSGHFGKPHLDLVFQNAEVTGDRDLVAYGSRIFDRMLTYLERRGTVTVQRLPTRHNGGEELLRAVRPTNVAITNLKLAEQTEDLLIFNWHITYRADDKREELYTVLLDGHGNRLPHSDEPGAPATAVRLDTLWGEAEPVPAATDSDGEPLPMRLPPLSQLASLAETARRFALYYADLRSVEHEREILPRLHKVLARLTTYYQEQIQEVSAANDPHGEKRRALEEDLQRKIGEEVENHRLRVQVRLFSYAILQVPITVADITLGNGRQESSIRVWRNRYDGLLHRPHCHVCAQEMALVTVDRAGHTACAECVHPCHSCHDLLCAQCGVHACSVCGQDNCTTCGQLCWACGERACGNHVSPCPVCGDTVCHSCQTVCAVCHTQQCRSHLRADVVDERMICADCAVRCPGCHQYSAQVATCDASGQRFCTHCLIHCTACGRQLGTGFYHVDPEDGQPYCPECIASCPSCHALTRTHGLCLMCSAPCCLACGERCQICSALVCAEHRQRHSGCAHTTCGRHVVLCGVGQERLCPVCAPVCGICDRKCCVEHGAICSLCQQEYCRECVGDSGLCATCLTLQTAGRPVDLAGQTIGDQALVAPLVKHYRWVTAANQRVTLYLGKGSLGLLALIVVRNGMVTAVRRTNLLDRLLGKEWS